MAPAEQTRLLESTIAEVKAFQALTRAPYSLEWKMLQLMEADQSATPDLWNQLRDALASTRQMRSPALRKFLRRPYLASQGYWWWDPSEWTTPQPAPQ